MLAAEAAVTLSPPPSRSLAARDGRESQYLRRSRLWRYESPYLARFPEPLRRDSAPDLRTVTFRLPGAARMGIEDRVSESIVSI